MKSRSGFADRLTAAFWRRVSTSTTVSPASLGVFRWCYGLFLLLLEAPDSAWVDHVPRAFFNPPLLSLANLAPGFPPPPTFLVIDLLILAALVSMTVGFWTRTSTLSVAFLDLFAAHFRYSLGKIDHTFASTALLFCMAGADWGQCCSFDAMRERRRPADPSRSRYVSAFAVMIAAAMLSAGLPKAMVWIDFDLSTSGILYWFLPGYFSLGRSLLLASLLARAPLVLLEIADYVGPLLELASIVALLASRRAWLGWLACACAFHLLNVLFLNIDFKRNVMLYAVFIEAGALAPAFTPGRMKGIGLFAATVAASHAWMRFGGGGTQMWLLRDPEAALIWGFYAAVPICLASMLALFAGARSSSRAELSRDHALPCED